MSTSRRRGGATSIWETNREQGLDGFFGAMRSGLQEATGGEVLIGSEADRDLVGLPLPALCLRYLFQSTTFPLSRMTQITGEEGSCKSSFLYELMRWHFIYGGGAVLAENEDKDSPELRNSIFRWNPQWLSRFQMRETGTLEEWQQVLTHTLAIARASQDAPRGPGRTIPLLVGIDSLMGTTTEEQIIETLKLGHSKRGFAIEALLISRYMRTVPRQLRGYPFTIVGTNHLKPSTDYMGRPTGSIPGGKAVKFYETFEIEMQRVGDIDTLDYGGIRLNLKARKNSIGPSRKQIQAELVWWNAPDHTGVMRQQTAWDWETATIELLLGFETAKGKKTLFDAVMEVCDLRVISRSQRTLWSRALGVTQENPVYYRQAGAMLEQRPDLLLQIYPLLGITARRPFQSGVDYRELQATAQSAANEEAQNRYTEAPTLTTQAGGVLVADVIPEAPPEPGESEAASEDDAEHEA